MLFLLAQNDGVAEACGDDPGAVCETVYDWWGNEAAAKAADWLVHKPLTILLIIVGGWILTRLARRLVHRIVERARRTAREARERAPTFVSDAEVDARADARADTITRALLGGFIVVIWSVVILLVLGELGVNLGPLIAGAGIAGVALGFGAQSVVKDVISGLFILIEDQFGVGDVVDLGECEGTVESLGLRSTRLRDVYGVMWHVPNGEILRVANKSQLWARALLDIEVAYDADLRQAQEVIRAVAHGMWEDPEWGDDEMADEPEVWGIQNLGPDGVSIRVVMKTEPAKQWAVEREFRLRVKEALEAAGIEIPFPQRTVWIRHEGAPPPADEHEPAGNEHSGA